ncbi:MAG TPA: CHASE2 domain-containing protein [Sideroxyarcus sp.]|nr:CHASE2 domain-containing protein [Sideroxyarcus sp.]
MKIHLVVLNRIRQLFLAFYELLARRWKKSFYLYLAAVFSVLAIADTAFLHVTQEMRQGAFDMMVRYRISPPKPDPDIVIVDINEASLAAMAKDYGRWPWPRQVLGEFLENIEKQQPQAVVFDILFSDADVYNPDSDAYFDAAVAATGNTFFPMLRLDPDSDALSQIKPAMIPGVTPLSDAASKDATVAVVLPHFAAALNGGRLGLHNIYPDVDGTARRYQVYRDDYGWKMPSLPARVAEELGWPQAPAQQVLLNWRGKPFSYHYVSFSDVFEDMARKQKTRPADEFKGKIVIIGSTAPSLFDIKPTPMSKMHQGVEILATAIDNMKHGDYLRFPEARIAYLLLTLALVWVTAWAFYRNVGRDKIDRLFGFSQFLLIAISYASINLSNTYINLTGPVAIAIAFFTIARIYATGTYKALEQNMVRASAERSGELDARLLLIRLDASRNVYTDVLLERIRNGLERSGKESKSVDVVKGVQKGLWDLFEYTFAVSWVAAPEDAAAAARIDEDKAAVLAALPVLLKKNLARADDVATWFEYRGQVAGGDKARSSWRVLFAEAVLQWERQREAK